MVKIYVKQIVAGKMIVPDVPDKWRDEVKAVFDAMLVDGEITQEQWNKYMGKDGEPS